jgi:hypothetical protein
VFLIGLSAAGGSWRVAYVGAALLAAAVWLLVLLQRHALEDVPDLAPSSPAPAVPVATQAPGVPNRLADPASVAAQVHPLDFLKLPVLWMCFSFFFLVTAALAAIQTFSGPALHALYGLPLADAATVDGFTQTQATVAVSTKEAALRTQLRRHRTAKATSFLMAVPLAIFAGFLIPPFPAALGMLLSL